MEGRLHDPKALEPSSTPSSRSLTAVLIRVVPTRFPWLFGPVFRSASYLFIRWSRHNQLITAHFLYRHTFCHCERCPVMPMRLSPTTDTDPNRIETMFPRISPIMNSLSPATQSDILGILQREQDRAVALLASSPLLASLFVSYANQAAALESVSATSPTESDEWKALENTISTLQEEVDKLKPENIEMAEKLGAGTASLEAFRSQVASLKEVNTTHEREIHSLRAELIESKDGYDRLLEDSNAERDSLLKIVSDLEIQRADLRETVVEQQLKIAKLGRQGLVEREEKEKAKQEAKHGAHQETGRGGEERRQKSSAPAILSTWGSAVEEDGPQEKVSSLSRRGQKKDRDGGRGVAPTEKESKARALSPIDPSSVPVDSHGGGKPVSLAKKDPSGSAVKVKLRAPPVEEDEDFYGSPSPPTVMPARVSVRPEIEHRPDAEQRPSPPPSPRPTPAPKVEPETFSNPATELKAPRCVKEEVPTAPKPFSSQLPIPASIPVKDEVEKPLSLQEGKKPKAVISPAPASSFPAGGKERDLWGEWGCDNRGNPEKREGQSGEVGEGRLGPNPTRRNDSARSQNFTRPATKHLAPAPAQKADWGWGGSILNTLASAVASERSPSPEPASVKPKIEVPPRGFTPGQPPKSQPAGLGSSDKPTWGDTRGAKPSGRGPTWGNAAFGSEIGGGLVVDTTKPPESRPSTPFPEDIPELSESLPTDEEVGAAQGVSGTPLSALNAPDADDVYRRPVACRKKNKKGGRK